MEENKKWEKVDAPEEKKLCFCQIFFSRKFAKENISTQEYFYNV